MGQTGLILAAWIGLGTLITYLFGPLSRLLGRVFLARLGLLGSLFALLLIGLAHNLFLAQLGLYSFGLFLFLILPALQASVGDKVPPSNQSQAFSLVSNIQIIAGAIFSLLAGLLSDLVNIQAPFLMMALMALLALWFNLWALSGKRS